MAANQKYQAEQSSKYKSKPKKQKRKSISQTKPRRKEIQVAWKEENLKPKAKAISDSEGDNVESLEAKAECKYETQYMTFDHESKVAKPAVISRENSVLSVIYLETQSRRIVIKQAGGK